MRRTCALFMIVFGTSALAAQESTFRYASDPFAAKVVAAVTEETEQNSASDAEPFESYETADEAIVSRLQQKAIDRAEQRRRRIEARRWYGHSQSRPLVFANPYMTTYAPMWMNYSWVNQPWQSHRSWNSSYFVLGETLRTTGLRP